MTRNRHDGRLWILFGAAEADAPTWVCKIPPSSIEKTDSQPVGFSLNGTHLALQNCMSLICKDERGPESGLIIMSNLFIFNNLAERVGFELSSRRSFNNIENTAGTVKAMEDNGKQC